MKEKLVSDATLDVRGLLCPLPLLRTKKALKTLQDGQVLYVLCTDPSTVEDFKAFAQQTTHTLLAQQQEGTEFYFWICK